MSLQSRRRALLVTGMHRSGTSCVTRIANLTGLAIGSDLLPSQPDNPRGFWEHAGLSGLNDEILARLDTTWDSLAPLPDAWWESSTLDEPKRRMVEIIRADFAGEADFVVKDPRICLLVPLWRDVLMELGCEVEFLIVIRDVNAVIASLNRRNNFPRWHSELLWLRYNLMAEYQTREDRRAAVHYEDVVHDWRATFGKITGKIALRIPDPGSDRSDAIDSFVSPQLDHASTSASAETGENSPWALEVAHALSRDGALDDSTTRAELDRVREELLASDPLLAPQDRHWRSEYLRMREDSETFEARLQSMSVAWNRRMDAVMRHVESDRRETSRLLERFESLESESRRRHREETDRLILERDDLKRQQSRDEAALMDLEKRLKAATERERVRESQIEALEAAVERARADLGEAREMGRKSQAAADRLVSGLREQLLDSQSELARTRDELSAHAEVLRKMTESRSWKITQPLRNATELLGLRDRHALDPGLRHPVPWHELLPGRPFRQRFWSPLPRLAAIGIGFFSYGRENDTSVRVRLFEDRRIGRPARLIEEVVLQGCSIQDGRTSQIVLQNPIADAGNRGPFLVEVESLDGEPDKTVTVALGQPSYRGQILSRDRRGEAKTKGLLLLDMLSNVVAAKKAFAFVSGCPGGAYRYRCVHQAEMLRLRGYSVDVLPADEFPWSDLLDAYQVVVAHRVPHTPEYEGFIEAARERGIHVVFDTDDLVFAPEIEDQIAALDDLSDSERELWLDGVQRYRKSLSLAQKAMVSTPALKRSIESRLDHIEVRVSRNRLSDEMVAHASAPKTTRPDDDPAIRIGYLSGTPTHRRDFAECIAGLESVMSRHPHVRLSLVGHIDVPAKLAPLSDRVDLLPLVPWEELPAIYVDLDINLAPLERNNEFTEGKSELKFFEAGLLGVPTVASRVGSFIDAIRDGEDGYLCDTTEDWVAALERLVVDHEHRMRMGKAAKRTAYERYTSRAAACETVECWLDLLGPSSEIRDPLRVAVVVRAPIANTGGGYKKIFHLVHHLSTGGHDVTVYVEPIAHLQEKSQEEIDAFCREHFECGSARIVAGHDVIEDNDVAIATNWPTANVVAALPNARLRLYFIQDDERQFYDEGDPLRAAAAATYDLPLLIVGIGRYLSQMMGARNRMAYPHIDFALGDVFFEERAATRQLLEAPATPTDASLLFFARPDIPRRGFDMGVEALTRFQRERPDVEIRLYGLEEPRDLPFDYVDLGVIDQSELAREMRAATAHLSFSRTNPSTVIFEAMACGAVAIELGAEGVRSLLDDPETCVLCDDSAEAVAKTLIDLFGDPERMRRIAKAGFESVENMTIDNMCHQFESILLQHSLVGRTADR